MFRRDTISQMTDQVAPFSIIIEVPETEEIDEMKDLMKWQSLLGAPNLNLPEESALQ